MRPYTSAEIGGNSGDEHGHDTWLQIKKDMMIDDFTDVNGGEKRVMKAWNQHVLTYRYQSTMCDASCHL